MDADGYRVVRTLARPPRAVVAYEPGPNWMAAATDALRWLSERWGGAGGVVVPVGDSLPVASRELLRHLGPFDPDVVVHRPVLFTDLNDEQLSRAVADMSEPGTSPISIQQARQRLGDLSYGEDLRQKVRDTFIGWCAPQHPWESDGGQPIESPLPFSHETEAPFSPTPVVTGVQARAVTFDLSELDPAFALVVSTRAGIASPGAFGATIAVAEEDLAGLAEWALTGGVADGQLPCIDQRVRSGAGVLADDLFSALPLQRTAWKLAWVRQRRASYTAVLVVGDSPEDHSLGMLAGRATSAGAWVPANLMGASGPHGDAMRQAAAAFLLRSLMGAHRRKRVVTSMSLEPAELRELFASVGWLPDDVEFLRPEDLILDDRRFLGDWSSVARQVSHPVAVDGGRTVLLTSIEPPVPEAVTSGGDATWFVDVAIDGVAVPPARSGLAGPALLNNNDSGGLNMQLIRSSNGGVSFWSESSGLTLAGSPREAAFARPLVAFPGATEAVQVLAKTCGLRVASSSAGLRSARVADMWNGHDKLVPDLSGPVRRMLDGFASERPDDWDFGCLVGKQAFLDFDGATRLLALPSPGDARSVVDRLLVQRVLQRVMLLRCGRCDRLDQYRIEEVASAFTCKSCVSVNDLVADRWRLPIEEPKWFYALDPLVADFFEQNGDVPVRAAHQVLTQSSGVGDAGFEIEFTRVGEDGPWIEIDFTCLVGGRLYVGEAKKNGRLQGTGRSLRRMARRFADLTVALQADVFVAASAGPEWSPATKEALDEAMLDVANHAGAPVPSVQLIVLD